jgi:hypothetical protein
MKSKKINSKPASITDISSKGSISNLRIPSSSVISGPLPSASGGVYYNIPYVEEASGDTLRIDPKKVLEDIIKSEDTELAEDMKLVLNYLRGYLEKIMDSPEMILEIESLKKELQETKDKLKNVEARLKELDKKR